MKITSKIHRESCVHNVLYFKQTIEINMKIMHEIKSFLAVICGFTDSNLVWLEMAITNLLRLHGLFDFIWIYASFVWKLGCHFHKIHRRS